MDDCTWTFSRQDEKLQIRRRQEADGCVLEITTDGTARLVRFADLPSLIVFQTDMEALLLKTGWSFLSFRPDQRSGRDRRDWPRINERRRWWTDRPPPDARRKPRK